VMLGYFEERSKEFKNQAAMARKTKIKASHVSNVLSGTRLVSLEMLSRIANTIGPTMSEILHILSVRCYEAEAQARRTAPSSASVGEQPKGSVAVRPGAEDMYTPVRHPAARKKKA